MHNDYEDQIHNQTAAVVVSIHYRHSEQLDQLFGALAEAQGEMTGASKDKIAKVKSDKADYSYKYSDLQSVIEACREPLSKSGICVIQPPCAKTRMISVLTNRGEQAEQTAVEVTVTTLLGHKSGQWIACDLVLVSSQITPQGIGSAITYGRRYGLQSMAGVASDDDDGAAASAGRQPENYQSPKRVTPPAEPELQKRLDRCTMMKPAMDVIGELKSDLHELTGDGDAYLKALKRHGIETKEQLSAITLPVARDLVRELYSVRVLFSASAPREPQGPTDGAE